MFSRMTRSVRSFQEEAERLRARGLTYRQIAAEFRGRHGVNTRVAYRLAHGLSQADVAERWNTQWPDPEYPKNAKAISYWEVWPAPGGRAPSLDTLNKLAYLYRCSAGELLDGEDFSSLDPANAVDPDVDDRVDTPSPSPTSNSNLGSLAAVLPAGTITAVTSRMVEGFEALTNTYRQADYRSGSRSVSADVTGHLRRMLEVSDRATSKATHRRLMEAIGDAAQLSGWLAIDAQNYHQALGRCRLGLSIAEKINDRALHAYTLGVISYIHLHAGDGSSALRVLDTAKSLAARDVPPAVTSWIYEAIGEAHGLRGEPQSGGKALATAERRFDGVTVDNTPVWLTFFNSECHAARLKGRCLMRLYQPQQAVNALHEALTLLPATFVRERSGTLIDLAHVHIQLHQIEEACHVATQADALARRTRSERNRRRLRQLLVDLMPWTELDCVRDLYRQVLLN
jgi:transcriptional regulator with XRE-family HTH domain